MLYFTLFSWASTPSSTCTANYINNGITIGTSYSAINYKSNHNTSDNNWHNYCVVLYKLESPKTIDFKIFEDGEMLTIENNSINKLQSVFTQIGMPLTFGGMTTSIGYGNVFFQGSLDEISFYNRALTDQEIKQLYERCPKETATSNIFNSVVYTTNAPLNLTATPAEGTFSVALNGYSYKMVDLQGKQVYKELVTKSKTEISLKSIGAKGVYILHVLDAQGVSIENKKIVLE